MKNKKIIAFAGVAIIVVILAVVLFNQQGKEITFNDEYFIEYGEEPNYEKMIKEVKSEKSEIIYPKDVIFDKVGKYELEFKIKGNDEIIKHEVAVKDTNKPAIYLEKEIDEPREIIINSEFNVFENIKRIKNMPEDSLNNSELVSKEEFDKIISETKKENKKMKNRKVTKNTKNPEKYANKVFYTTDFTNDKEGDYVIDMVVIDENYNHDEETWIIKVFPEGSIVNTGGKVFCNSVGSNIELLEGYSSITEQVMLYYDKDEEIYKMDHIITVELLPDYQDVQNINSVINNAETKFSSKGIQITNEKFGNAKVIIVVTVDVKEYDYTNDPVGIINEKSDNGYNFNIEFNIKEVLNKGGACDVTID